MEDASLSDAEIREIGNFAFLAQLQSAYTDLDCAAPNVALNRSEKSATVTGNCEVPTLFGAGISGHESISVSGASSAVVKVTKKLCRTMRDGNVVIYAVAFQAPASAKTTLRHCAHASSRYFEATTGEELLKAYAAIASQLSALTLTE